MGMLNWLFRKGGQKQEAAKQEVVIEQVEEKAKGFFIPYCPNCQKEFIIPSGNFCGRCGTVLEQKSYPTCECGEMIIYDFCVCCGKDNREIKASLKIK